MADTKETVWRLEDSACVHVTGEATYDIEVANVCSLPATVWVPEISNACITPAPWEVEIGSACDALSEVIVYVDAAFDDGVNFDDGVGWDDWPLPMQEAA